MPTCSRWREVGVPVVQHLVGNDLSPQLLELARAGLLRPGDEYIHCLEINDAAWRLIKDTGGQVSDLRPDRGSLGGYSHESSSNHSGAPRDNLSNHCLLESLEAKNADATEVSGASSKPRSLTRGTIPRRSPPCKIIAPVQVRAPP
jgi:hypothetical protein